MHPHQRRLDELIDLLCLADFQWPQARGDLSAACHETALHLGLRCECLHQVLEAFAHQAARLDHPPPYLNQLIRLLAHAVLDDGRITDATRIPVPLRPEQPPSLGSCGGCA